MHYFKNRLLQLVQLDRVFVGDGTSQILERDNKQEMNKQKTNKQKNSPSLVLDTKQTNTVSLCLLSNKGVASAI